MSSSSNASNSATVRVNVSGTTSSALSTSETPSITLASSRTVADSGLVLAVLDRADLFNRQVRVRARVHGKDTESIPTSDRWSGVASVALTVATKEAAMMPPPAAPASPISRSGRSCRTS